ncbi:PBECR2 nuclease fold domain-containing protein, partial [Campylobacter upsaliensis]
DLRANEKGTKLETKGSEDIIFTDKKGKEHTLTKETQKAWLEAFNLKSLEEAYIPNFKAEVKEAINRVLGGEEIKLTKGSLYKIVEKGREKYIPQMKQTLQNPDFALRDRDNMLILAKQIEDKQYFTSVNLETKDYFISVSNAPKKENILKNKVENGAEILYQSPNAKSIFYTDTLLQTDKSSANKIDEDIIAQNAKSESEKEVLERQIPLIEAEIQKYEAKIASLDERIKKTQTRIQPYLDEINALQKQYDELYFTETRGEEANAKKWLKLEEIKAKQEELRKPYNDALFKFVFPHQRLKGKVQTEIQKLKFGLQDRALRLEEIQNEALNTSKAQKAWLEAFNLKSLEEAYIPNFKAEVKEAINRVLGGEEIKLTKGSFEKLLKRDREEFLPYIKDTLEKANAVIKQVDGALIFAKDYRNERLGKFFASVSRNDEGEWIITSNAPKNLNNLKNKLNEGGELLYSDLPELTIIAKPDLDANALNSEANLKDIIPQKANLEAVNKQKDKEFLEAYEKADFKGKVELAKQDINEEIKFLEKQKEEFERITQQKDYNDIELEQARKILENAKEEVEGHYRIKYMQNGKEMRAYISKTDYFNEGKILSKDEILHKIIQKTICKDKIENIKKTSDKLKKQIKIIDEYLKEYGDNEAGAISDDIIEKFKYYNFAKDTGKGEIIIGERRKGLYEQAQKVLNSRLLKAKKRATQSKKNYNITYDEARKLFYKGDMSEEQKELFQSVLPIAQKLNVRIRTAIREPYEDMIKDTTNIAGMYRYELNTATLKKGGNYTDTQRAETLLHELIHSVTSRAMSLYKTPLRDKMLSKTQIKAIDEIDQIYKKLYKFKKTFKLQDENGADLYGIKNSHEMLAELANPMFSSKLKEIGLYEKLVNNIMKIILSVRDFIRLRSDKNVYEKLKQCLKDIIENYKDDFTQEYEKQNIRDFTLTSQTQKEQIYTQRQEIKNTLKAKINQAITNENTGEKAILTNKGISKMLSDKAISKSVDNGFSREEHLRAVGVVDELFKRAKRAFSKRDEKDKNLSIYRYNAPFKNANALMTLKEYKQNGKRIYSLELENLEAAKFNPSGKDLAEQLSKSKDADTTTFHTPIDNPDESIAQKSDNIYHSNPHLGAGLVGGVLNGVEQDENGNLSFDPVKFAMGFLGGSGGSFALKKSFQILEKNPELKEKIINELADTLAQGFEKVREKYPLLSLLEPRYIVKNEKGRKIQAKTMLKELEREQKGLYNVAFNGKNAVLIKKDLEAVDEAILFEKGTKRKGGKHIRLAHSTEPSQEGYVTKQEVANLGVNIREYLKNYEPFIDKNGARLYEWKDENGVKFRAVVNNTQTSGGNSHLPSATEEIITFYSDRNLKEKMNFKNPLLKDTIAESTMQGEALSKELESKEANTHTLREQTKGLLKPFTHKLIKNKNDNTKAIVTMSGIKEMLSAKAINQSVKNGFKAKQHIKAVMALPTLFENAVFKDKQAQRHFKDYVEAYRVYSADFEGGKAIISVQERKIGNDVLYFLKLGELRLNNA